VKVNNSIQITGPLSRNRAIGSLKPGDTVRVAVLEKIDATRAVLDLLGNRVTAHFEEGVPRNSKLMLTITGNSNGKLVFRHETETSASVIKHFSLFSETNSDTFFLRTLRQYIPDILTFNRLYREYRLKKRMKDHKKLFSRLSASGFSDKEVSAFSKLMLSKLPGSMSGLIDIFMADDEKLEADKQNFFQKLEDCNHEDIQMVLDYLFDESSFEILLNIDRAYRWFSVLLEEQSVCVSFEFDKTGLIQLVAREGEDQITLSIFFEKEDFRKKFLSQPENLDIITGIGKKKVIVLTHLLENAVAELNAEIKQIQQKPLVDLKA
jgi:hypothetical protein